MLKFTQGTGWVSELNPRKGVLTFEHNGKDERVLFLASKVWCFEKRLGARQPLTDVLSEGDPVQFEAVAQDPAVEEQQQQQQAAAYHCPWFAHMVWKGRRPAGADAALSEHVLSPITASEGGNRTASPSSHRRASLGSDNSTADVAGISTDEVRYQRVIDYKLS